MSQAPLSGCIIGFPRIPAQGVLAKSSPQRLQHIRDCKMQKGIIQNQKRSPCHRGSGKGDAGFVAKLLRPIHSCDLGHFEEVFFRVNTNRLRCPCLPKARTCHLSIHQEALAQGLLCEADDLVNGRGGHFQQLCQATCEAQAGGHILRQVAILQVRHEASLHWVHRMCQSHISTWDMCKHKSYKQKCLCIHICMCIYIYMYIMCMSKKCDISFWRQHEGTVCVHGKLQGGIICHLALVRVQVPSMQGASVFQVETWNQGFHLGCADRTWTIYE